MLSCFLICTSFMTYILQQGVSFIKAADGHFVRKWVTLSASYAFCANQSPVLTQRCNIDQSLGRHKLEYNGRYSIVKVLLIIKMKWIWMKFCKTSVMKYVLSSYQNLQHLYHYSLINRVGGQRRNREFKISQRGRGRERLETIQFNYIV